MMNAGIAEKNSESRTNWVRLHVNDDSCIDYSDIPDTTKEFWKDAHIFICSHSKHTAS